MKIEVAAKKYITDHIFILTMICEYVKEINGKFRLIHPSKYPPNFRAVGLSHDVDSLRESLGVDDFGISEGGSNTWAVIEAANIGLCVYPRSLQEWYRYDKNSGVYRRIRQPKWSKGIVGWGVG